jgi:hypothetical protein
MKGCKVEGCANKHNSHGYCGKHVLQIKRHGKIIPDKTRFEIRKRTVLIYLYNKTNLINQAIIDKTDYDKVKKYIWWQRKDNYVLADTEFGRIRLHRLITGAKEGEEVDHIDLNPLNNRRSNLRVCTKQNNSFNRTSYKNSKSGIKGVWYSPANECWCSQITYQNKRVCLGSFSNPVEAAEAYNDAAIKYHEKFAHINDIEDIKIKYKKRDYDFLENNN